MSKTETTCPDCGSDETREDNDYGLHCLDCGEINDAYSRRFNNEGIDVDVRPFWRREKGREEVLGVTRLYTRMDADAFIGVEGLTVKVFFGPVEHTEPDVTEADSAENAATCIEQSMDEFNDLHMADYTLEKADEAE